MPARSSAAPSTAAALGPGHPGTPVADAFILPLHRYEEPWSPPHPRFYQGGEPPSSAAVTAPPLRFGLPAHHDREAVPRRVPGEAQPAGDRKSTRLNSSH